jgi:hypothetical protein
VSNQAPITGPITRDCVKHLPSSESFLCSNNQKQFTLIVYAVNFLFEYLKCVLRLNNTYFFLKNKIKGQVKRAFLLVLSFICT